MPYSDLENRITNLEYKQNTQERVLKELNEGVSDLKATHLVQSKVLEQHTAQNAALLRDQRQVLTAVSAIEAIIKTGSMLTALVRWMSSVVIATVGIYAAYKMVQSGDFHSFFHMVNM